MCIPGPTLHGHIRMTQYTSHSSFLSFPQCPTYKFIEYLPYLCHSISHQLIQRSSWICQVANTFCPNKESSLLHVPFRQNLATRYSECTTEICPSFQYLSPHVPQHCSLLQHFFDNKLKTISGDTLFKYLPAVDMPELKVFKHKFAERIAADQDDLSLQKIAGAIKADKHVFQTLADPILDSLDYTLEPELFSWTSINAVSDTIIIIVLCLAMAVLRFRGIHTH